MNNLAIYRKYRPSNFDEVSGQKTVVNILKNSIKNNSVSHAYLFTGPRGTGKTSIAKIFARTINCEELKQYNPCNNCEKCKNSIAKECSDIIEIDAASNNGVDEIRDLKSKINIVPSFLKYKVYIIDEVHMLSIGAFNALLKTLEEPPAHVIFILATTELQKVPATILSRCQILEFKKISALDMKNKLNEICRHENIRIEDDAIDEIINFSDGCMRDALSLLEKINSYCENNILAESVREVCGKPKKETISNIIGLIDDQKLPELINEINNLYINNFEMLYVVEDIIKELENIIFKMQKSEQKYIEYLKEFIKIYDNMKKSSVEKRIIFEIGVMNFFNKKEENISREIFYRTKIEQKTELKEDKILKGNIDLTEFKEVRTNNAFVEANKQILNDIKNKWIELQKYAFDKEKGSSVCVLLDTVPVLANDKYIVLKCQYLSIADKINESHDEYENILKEFLNNEYYIVALDDAEWNIKKEEYIKNISSGKKYNIIADTFLNNNLKSDIIRENESNKLSNETVENKIYELFDSNDVEIK